VTKDEEFEQARREYDLEHIALHARDMLEPLVSGEIERGRCVAGQREAYGGKPGKRKTTLADARRIARNVTAYINQHLRLFDERYRSQQL
jgi:hypothetical protein